MFSKLGLTLLIELKNCSPAKLNSIKAVRTATIAAAKTAGATITKASFHKSRPIGVNGAIVLTKASITIHTWPKKNYAFAVLCDYGNLDTRAVYAFLIKEFESKNPNVMKMQVGISSDLQKNSAPV